MSKQVAPAGLDVAAAALAQKDAMSAAMADKIKKIHNSKHTVVRNVVTLLTLTALCSRQYYSTGKARWNWGGWIGRVMVVATMLSLIHPFDHNQANMLRWTRTYYPRIIAVGCILVLSCIPLGWPSLDDVQESNFVLPHEEADTE